ncbi:MAG TPA: 5-formyltetrahydrofolate cyclo-ligase [Aliidongia sp.]|nr:5-formyltetrahydrofolate cyclo-ligase [Aliidongia sp.]
MANADIKAELRRAAEERRAASYAADPGAGAVLARYAMHLLGERSFVSIAAYWPIRTEIDVRPLLLALAQNGRDTALPVIRGRGEPLEFRRWRPGFDLTPGAFGTLGPAAAPVIEPDVLLVPLLAFDRQHRRLGYGAGFYDRTIALLRRRPLLVLGVAFAAQEIEEVPVDSWDEPLDLVLTERGIL